jgi:hypothetical protein
VCTHIDHIFQIENLRKWSGEREEVFVENKAVSLENIVPQIYFDFAI